MDHHFKAISETQEDKDCFESLEPNLFWGSLGTNQRATMSSCSNPSSPYSEDIAVQEKSV